MIDFKWLKFSDLTVEELYAILALRFRVFVLEQKSLYLDPDGEDVSALHLLGKKENQLVAYLRVFPPSSKQDFVLFGRVVCDNSVRGLGLGKKLMKELLDYCQASFPGKTIECSAQLYLKKFYEEFGFKKQGDVYDDAGVPHICMIKSPY